MYLQAIKKEPVAATRPLTDSIIIYPSVKNRDSQIQFKVQLQTFSTKIHIVLPQYLLFHLFYYIIRPNNLNLFKSHYPTKEYTTDGHFDSSKKCSSSTFSILVSRPNLSRITLARPLSQSNSTLFSSPSNIPKSLCVY